LKQTEPISTLKTGICRKYFVQKLTCFSELNNGLDAPASNTDDFPCRDQCFSSNQLNRPICSKQSLSLSETPKLQEVFLSKSNSVLTRNQCVTCSYL
jgi:hypothetical protein